MNNKIYNDWYAGRCMQVVWDHNIRGTVVDYDFNGYLTLETPDKRLRAFPEEQLEWCD